MTLLHYRLLWVQYFRSSVKLVVENVVVNDLVRKALLFLSDILLILFFFFLLFIAKNYLLLILLTFDLFLFFFWFNILGTKERRRQDVVPLEESDSTSARDRKLHALYVTND
jgi:hypothetical protein